MKREYIISAIVLAVIFLGCHKDNTGTPPPIPAEFPLLKEIVVPNLPSPYYHFEYDANGIISRVSFASGFIQYEAVYTGNRLSELRSFTPDAQDKLQYAYDNNGKANFVAYVDKNGKLYRRAFITYTGNQLAEIEWELKVDAGFQPDRTLTFTYQADSNLLELKDQRFAVGSQTAVTLIDHFENYDNKINKDGFSLVKPDFFDHLLLLPGVKFQKNNPAKVTRSGTGNNYIVNYNYTYNNNNVPLTQTGDLLYTSGPDSAKHFNISQTYSYY
ncbi:MAG: hypothetical protein JST75_19585 [Bacteroidetes bacterium]|nr:hypothetical protein [Bacteroidota bacterium]